MDSWSLVRRQKTYNKKCADRNRPHFPLPSKVGSLAMLLAMARPWAWCPRPHDARPRDYPRLGYYRQAAPSPVSWQLGDVHRYASSLIESKGVCYSGMARISVAVDIGECLSIRVHDLEATL